MQFFVFGRGGHAQVNGAGEVVENFLPGAPAGAVGFVDDNEVKEIGREVLIKSPAVAVFASQVLVDGKVKVAIEG